MRKKPSNPIIITSLDFPFYFPRLGQETDDQRNGWTRFDEQRTRENRAALETLMHRYISYIRERRKILPVGWERWVTRWVGIENGKTSTCVNSRYLLLSSPCFSIGSRGKKIDLLREIDRAFYRWSRCCENVNREKKLEGLDVEAGREGDAT